MMELGLCFGTEVRTLFGLMLFSLFILVKILFRRS